MVTTLSPSPDISGQPLTHAGTENKLWFTLSLRAALQKFKIYYYSLKSRFKGWGSECLEEEWQRSKRGNQDRLRWAERGSVKVEQLRYKNSLWKAASARTWFGRSFRCFNIQRKRKMSNRFKKSTSTFMLSLISAKSEEGPWIGGLSPARALSVWFTSTIVFVTCVFAASLWSHWHTLVDCCDDSRKKDVVRKPFSVDPNPTKSD